MTDATEAARELPDPQAAEFYRLITQLVGHDLAPVAAALASFGDGEEVLAHVGFDVPPDDLPVHAGGICIGTPSIATALSMRFERMRGQIELHPNATLLLSAFDVSQSSPWVETMRGVDYFLRNGVEAGRRAVLVMNREALTSRREHELRSLLSDHLITHIVFAKHSGGLSSVPQVLVRCEGVADLVQSRVRVASVTGDSRSARRLADEVKATLRGETVESGVTHLAPLPPPASPWDLAHLDGQRADLIVQVTQTPGVRKLAEMVDVVIARPQQVRDHDNSQEGEPLLKAGRVRDRLPPPSELDSQVVGERVTRIEAGDVVGRTLAPQHWAVAGRELDGVAVGTGVILLRNRGIASPALLAAYLRSSTAQRLNLPVGTGIQHLRRQDLNELPVPNLGEIEEPAGSDSLGEIDQAIDDLEALISGLRQRADQVFRSFDQSLVSQELQEAADEARLVKSQLHRQQDVARAFQDVYPYPMARAHRQFRQQQEPLAQHSALIRLIEAVLITLGSTAAAWARANGATATDVQQLGVLADKWRSGGPSLGHWLGTLDGVGKYARQLGMEAYGIADATRRLKGGRGLLPDLEALVAWRNSTAHGGAPRSGNEASNSVDEILGSLNSALEGVAFLADTEWLMVERADWQLNRNVFDVKARSLTGDHPDFEWTAYSSDTPQATGLVYMRHAPTESSIPLTPFVSLDVCGTCSVEELYYVDRLRESMGGLRSFTTGHVREVGRLRDEILDCFSPPLPPPAGS